MIDNFIGDNGVKYLCENIYDLPYLTDLDLSYNEITDVGGEMLIENIDRCKSLSSFSVKNNRISDYDDFMKRIRAKQPYNCIIF